MSDTPPPLQVEKRRSRFLDAFSIVWLVPIIALLAAGFVALRGLSERGPEIEILFDSASGVTANETAVRYRDVTVGTVTSVGFTTDLNKVKVNVRLDKDVEDFVDDSASFWIVRPEVSARGITGLDTVLTGVYIEGSWDDEPGTEQRKFEGLTHPPLIKPGDKGLKIELRALGQTQITQDIPILYRGIEVGYMGEANISQDGSAVFAEAFIRSPYDGLISSTTRFWNASGFSLNIGPGGASLNFESISSLISGGITFDTFVSGAEAVSDGVVFEVYSDEDSARDSVFNTSEGTTVNIEAVFDQNVPGLTTGAAVEMGGIRIGEVTSISGVINQEKYGDDRMRLQTVIALRSNRFGLSTGSSQEDVYDFLSEQTAAGMRLRLASSGILGTSLKIELVHVDDVPAAEFDRDAKPYPTMPTADANLSDLSASAEGLLGRLEQLPVEELMQSAIDFLDTTRSLVGSPEVRAVPGEVNGLLADARSLIGSEAVKAVPETLHKLLEELDKTVGEINEQQTVTKILAAVETIQNTAKQLGDSVEGVPQLVDRINDVAGKIDNMPLDDVANELSSLIASANKVIDTDAARQLPASLDHALDQLAEILEEFREGGAVENLNETLASARNAADHIANASDQLPAMMRQLSATLDQAKATLETYDQNSDLGREARAALRAVQTAAQNVSSLARAIERQPNSLITGR